MSGEKVTVDKSTQDGCFFQISIGGEIQPEKVVMQLDTQNCPKTSQSFMTLCTSPDKTTSKMPQPTYRGCAFHRVVPGFVVQGGDFERFDGTGGYSTLWGHKFSDENLQGKHNKPGLLSMANSGKNTNGSQFFITLQATPHLDGKHVVFGQVVRGMATVHNMVNVERDAKDRPIMLQKISIIDCGVIVDTAKGKDVTERHRGTTNKKKSKRKTSSRSSSKKRRRSSDDDSLSSRSSSSEEDARKKSRSKKKKSNKSSSSDSSCYSSTSDDKNRKKRDKKRKKRHNEKRRRKEK